MREQESSGSRGNDITKFIDWTLLAILIGVIIYAQTLGVYKKYVYVEVCNGIDDKGQRIDITSLQTINNSHANQKCIQEGFEGGWWDGYECTGIKCYSKEGGGR